MKKQNEQRLVPKLRFKGFSEDWEQCKLKDILKVNSGRDYKHFAKGDIPVYGTGGLIARVDDFLSNQPAVGLGRKGTIDNPFFLEPPFWTVDTLFYLTSEKDNHINFIFYLLLRIRWKKYDESTGVPSLSKKTIENINVFSTKFEEQIKIAKTLEKINDLINLHKRKIQVLKDQKNLYLNKMFISQQGDVQLRFKGFIEPWEQRELKEIGEDYSGLSGKTKKDFGHGESLYVPYKNIFNNHIVDVNNLEKVNVKNKQNEVKYGDIFFTISSEIPEEVGMSSVMIENIKDLYLNSFSFGFRPHTETDLDVVFSSYLFRTPTFRKKMYILAQGISRYNISKTNVMKLEIALPSINEQKKIGKMMYRLDSMITLHNKKLNKLESLKKEYLNYLFI
ncbi:restriction endonuclease subunit S [Nosocomiicoccus ampullae]|uniref:restriction endonuclease subunit S n=1 Tax=Nosocomiicoccus ampullae TaxID=489910 RepID=UPI001C5FB747|nr:restriction endonuclease subunit S [Nosocomiicoccus ampullae]QYA46691.1 restriction endonuclease subunit S [Nosocomiicoccus ampullae]